MSRISKIRVIAVLFAALILGACSFPDGPSPIININNNLVNTNTVTISAPSTPGTTPAGCAEIARLRIGYPESLTVGVSGAFTVTPLDANGNERVAKCDTDAGISISSTPTNILTVEDEHAFVTKLIGKAVGEATVNVTVGTSHASVRVPVK